MSENIEQSGVAGRADSEPAAGVSHLVLWKGSVAAWKFGKLLSPHSHALPLQHATIRQFHILCHLPQLTSTAPLSMATQTALAPPKHHHSSVSLRAPRLSIQRIQLDSGGGPYGKKILSKQSTRSTPATHKV